MDRLITLQSRSETQNNIGEVVESFSTLAQVMAARVDLTSAEKFTAQQTFAETVTQFDIYFRTDIKPKDRMLDETGKVYDIIGITQLGRRRGLRLLARAKADA